MAITVKILADSLAPCGARLTTMEWTYPRSIHAEIMTHKMLSKNSASSRAIPTEKLIERVINDPFVPMYIGQRQKGMQAGAELTGETREEAERLWLDARLKAVETAENMLKLGVHKQVINRVLEPWMWITIIVSGTEYSNLFGLRLDAAAEPHFQHLARTAKVAMDESIPRCLAEGEWHLPLIDWDDEIDKTLSLEDLKKVAVGRCARVSYLTHDGRRDLKEDITLHDRLVVQQPLHASPAEHIAQAMDFPRWWKHLWLGHLDRPANQGPVDLRYWLNLEGRCNHASGPAVDLIQLRAMLRQMQSGNFYGFRQYRKTLKNEHIGGFMP